MLEDLSGSAIVGDSGDSTATPDIWGVIALLGGLDVWSPSLALGGRDRSAPGLVSCDMASSGPTTTGCSCAVCVPSPECLRQHSKRLLCKRVEIRGNNANRSLRCTFGFVD